MIHNRSAKKYLRRVRGMLPCSRKMKKCIMEQVCNEVSLFLEEQPNADYDAMISRFGEPENIAAAYIESMGTAEILKKFRVRKQLISAVAVVLILISITWAATVTWAMHSYETTNAGYASVTIK